MKLLQRIEEFTVSQNSTRREIAEFILENKLDIHTFSINQIAEKTYSSKSALVRFGKALGFNGWKDFSNKLIEDLRYEQTHYSEIDPNLPFSNTSDYKEIITNIATVQIESIQDTADRIDISQLKKAVEILKKSQRIVILGVSPNNLLGEIFRRKMLTIGKSVEVIQSGETGMAASGLTQEDAAIIISYSGNDVSREPMRFIPQMKKQGVKLIGLTSDGGNYIRQEVDTILSISSRERLYKKISNFSTEESILFLLNTLYACLFSKDYMKNYTFKVKNSINLEETRIYHQTDIKE
ncbi:MurR/RpiR family transcriptional regulator [Enterococcus raffinosus]|uniref:MurR/RpiR family transcriptional regulator n=1 Tax=Enterococcus raffinosus TaxID=71452 RepID=UPI001C12354B|nr:MurR/RpiR family transcriptional regulator [Enterococcus raffinosus]MBU5362567.1 MurR/RpiR family transcriptional regulator [Enterococcus raffinosus]